MRTGLRVVAAAVAAVVAFGGVHDEPWELACFLAAGLLHVEVGMRMWRARPDSRMGLLMVAAGFGWLADGVGRIVLPWLFRDDLMLGALYQPLVLHCALVIPVGRLVGWADRATALAGYFFWPAVLLAWWVTPGHRPGVAGLVAVRAFTYPVVGVALLAFLVWRYRRASLLYRSAYSPFWVANVLNVAATAVVSAGWYLPGSWPQIAYYAGSVAIPIGAALSLGRSQPPPRAIRSLVAALGSDSSAPEGLRDALREGLGDPTLEMLSPEQLDGAPWPGATVTRLRHAGREVGALVHDPALAAAPDVLHAVLRMAALVLDNQHQLREVQRSRRRLVEAADAERRRIERNIHDGVQQRLIAASLLLRRAERESGGPVVPLFGQGLAELETAINELREIARGMNPPALVMHGLAGAVESIAERSFVAVHVDDRIGTAAISDETAVTAYFVALEAVTNAEKHGGAEHVELRLTTVDGELVIAVRDDGSGGAAFVEGGGLEGLRDRVEAGGGRLELHSPPGAGTLLVAYLPLHPEGER